MLLFVLVFLLCTDTVYVRQIGGLCVENTARRILSALTIDIYGCTANVTEERSQGSVI